MGGEFNGLRFLTGYTSDYPHLNLDSNSVTTTTIEKEKNSSTTSSSNKKNKNEMDVLIALDACDTALDDAIYCGITNNARVIVTAPCCHKQLRTPIDKRYKNINK